MRYIRDDRRQMSSTFDDSAAQSVCGSEQRIRRISAAARDITATYVCKSAKYRDFAAPPDI